jgi:hypothetical protein
MPRGKCRSTPRVARIAAPVILAIALLAPRGALGDVPEPRGRLALELQMGGGDIGAPQILLGGGWAPVETGTLRLDLFFRLGFGQSQELRYEAPYGTGGDASLQPVSGHLDLAAAWRLGRFEPYAGGGFSVVGVSGTLETGLPKPQRLDGTSIWGPVAFGGLRVALGDQWLLGAEVRHQREGRSRVEAVQLYVPVGGTTGLLSVTWRLAPGGAQSAGSSPSRPEGPGALPGECAPGETLSIAVHPARAFRCLPDPVRGGHYCEPATAIGEFVERDACETACRGGTEPCASGGNAGAACDRCVKGCAEPRAVACLAATGWVDGRPVCVLPAGTYGLESERAVPASCSAAGRGR